MDDQPKQNVKGSQTAEPTCIVTKILANTGLSGQETIWLIKIMIAGMDSPGFLSSEMIPPFEGHHDDWRLLQRFRQESQAQDCLSSPQRKAIIAEMKTDLARCKGIRAEEELVSPGERGSVATAIVTEVKPGMDETYREWEGKVQVEQAKFDGYRGSYVQPPTSDVHPQWTTMLRFDTPETLDRWFNSKERKALLETGSQYVVSVDFQQLDNSFPGWFPTDPKTGKGPAVYKTFMLVLLGLFPIVMLEIKFLNPLLSFLNPSPANFIGNILSVAATTWITVPAAINAFSWWMLPPDDANKTMIEIKGIAILCLIYAVEIALLSKLL